MQNVTQGLGYDGVRPGEGIRDGYDPVRKEDEAMYELLIA